MPRRKERFYLCGDLPAECCLGLGELETAILLWAFNSGEERWKVQIKQGKNNEWREGCMEGRDGWMEGGSKQVSKKLGRQ